MTFLELALYCVRRGCCVIPCAPRDKHPLVKGGKGTKWEVASNDEAQVRAWWKQWPDANVAIGCRKSNRTVLDVDHGLSNEEDARAWIAKVGLPRTFTVRTGRRPEFGLQFHFEGTRSGVGEFQLEGCSGQVKSEDGYVMMPGSIHPDTGEAYTVWDDAPLAPMPDVVRNLKPVKREAEPGKPMQKIAEGGGRHAALTSVAGKFRHMGFDKDGILAQLIPANESMCEVPLSDEDLEHIAESVAGYALPEPEAIVIIGGSAAQPEAATLPERVRPEYPIAAWEGTVVAEFAKLCANDNNIPRKMYAEAFRCALGSVVGDRLSCPGVEGTLPRTYTVIVAPKGKGKGTAIRRAVRFFSQTWCSSSRSLTPALLSGARDFDWKPRGIGAWMAAASSVPGMARLCKDLDSTIKNKPHMTWGSTLPRILSVHEEMKTFLSTLFIEGGVGSGMEGVVCQLWDDVVFHGTATGTREAAYGEMMFSMLCGVTEQDWFDLLSRGDAVGGGLMSRFNIIGTEGEYENVSRMNPPDFAQLQETFLPRVMQLEDVHVHVRPTEAAEAIIGSWADNLPEGSERMNVHAWRSALLIAWLRHEESITTRTAEDAVRLGEYQTASHDYYRTKSADTANARVQAKLLRVLELKGPMSKRELQQRTNARRDGTELWSRALDGLLRDGAIGKRDDGAFYLAG
ncbi:MAG TPA: bifunctional DNA primase/polymerase [Terriglobales bacterium]|nr:bifunctional DNA primase/polymerase [Terriglobales bacterium]